MKILSVFLLLFVSASCWSQQLIPLIDFNNYFRSFQDGFFRQIEFQPITEFKAGDDLVAYMNSRGDLMLYDGVKPERMANMTAEYEVSDHLMTWKIGPTLNMWDDGFKTTLTYNARNYWVKDSIIVYEDLRFNSVNVYYNGKIYELYKSVGDVDSPDFIGENIVAFRDNGNFNKVFWRGQIYDLDVWHNRFKFEGGTDMIAFNDPINGTFAIFEKGKFLDVEEFHVTKYKVGRGFVIYESRNGDLMYYGNGVKKQISNFGASNWEVKDDVVIWMENNFMYAYVKETKYEVARYKPENYMIKNDVIVYRDMMGGVTALVGGEQKSITTQMNSEFTIYGSSVLVELFNRSYIVLSKGKLYTI
ncbi:MAG: hypothetical protein QNL61_08165 [Crocinitomicaceae bacterium]